MHRVTRQMEPVQTAAFHSNNILNITSPDPVAVIKTAQLGQKIISLTICMLLFLTIEGNMNLFVEESNQHKSLTSEPSPLALCPYFPLHFNVLRNRVP